MNKLRTLVLTLVLLLGTALPNAVSADNGDTTNNSSGMTPEVTIGFGNVTNDTLSFTMDTSVDVYSYQVLMSWDIGAVYCNINGSGGLSEAYNLFVSVLYAGCWTTGYYYGTQGIYHIPAGSNGTLTSIFYQSNSPEVCMGSASYAVLDANDELEWRNATVDPEECLTYTKHETRSGDLWYVLDEDSNDEGDNESEEEESIDDSFYPFNENLSVLENFENFEDFSILMEALEIAGLIDDLSPSNTPQMGWTMFAPTNDAFEAAGFNIDFFDTEEDIASLRDILLYHVSFAGPYGLALSCPYSLDWMPMANGGLDDPNDYSTWNQTVLVENDCQDILVNSESTVIDADNRVYGYEYNGVDGYPYNDQLPQGWPVAEDNGMIQVVDTLLVPLQYRQPDNANESDDSDGDGVGDNADAFPDDANEWDDSDGDGVGDNADAFPDDPTETFDSDGDGVGDNSDMFPFNALEFFDSDGDGVGDNTDAFPLDDTQWEDFDGDGYGDNPDGTTPDACITSGGTSLRALVPDGATTRYVSEPHYGCLDADGDGVGDSTDAFPNDASETLDSDGDGVGSNADQCPGTDTNVTVDVNGCALDGDNDGVPDVDDLCPEVDASTLDLNGDGCLDDDDADGVPNPQDDCPSTEVATEVSEAGCSEAQLRLLGEGSDDGKTNAGESSDAQTETAASSTQDRYILFGALLIFFVLLGTLTGTMAVSKKENSSFSTSFVEGGVAMDELLGLLGRSKMLNVMHALNAHGEGIRFTDLKINVDTSATTLSRRLGELEEFGLVSRTELPTVPMTVVYRLTDAGFSLMPRVESMFEWALINKQHGD